MNILLKTTLYFGHLHSRSGIERIFIFAFFVLGVALFNSGCNSKKFYTPAKIDGRIIFSQSFSAPIIYNNRYGATLKDGSLLTQNGIIPMNKQARNLIPKNAKFLNESGGYYIFAKGCESLVLVRVSRLDEEAFDSGTCPIKEENSTCTEDEMEVEVGSCVITASLKDDLLAFVAVDNSMNIVSLPSKESKFSQKGSSVIAVNQLVAAPIFLDSLVVFPSLDGRLLVVSTQNYETQRNIIVSSEKFFNNIIYLQGDDSRIFAATPKKLISIISGQQFSYTEELKDIIFYNGYLYALTLEGKIAQLDHTLREVNTRKFEYASLEGMIRADNTLYTYEKNGSFVIALNLSNFSYNVYQAQDAFGKLMKNKLNFYAKNIFYYDRYYFDFAKFADSITSK